MFFFFFVIISGIFSPNWASVVIVWCCLGTLVHLQKCWLKAIWTKQRCELFHHPALFEPGLTPGHGFIVAYEEMGPSRGQSEVRRLNCAAFWSTLHERVQMSLQNWKISSRCFVTMCDNNIIRLVDTKLNLTFFKSLLQYETHFIHRQSANQLWEYEITLCGASDR